MGSRIRAAVMIGAMVAIVLPGTTSAEEGTGLPGMCHGRSDPEVVIHARDGGPIKYILNVSTDSSGRPDGVMILGRGPGRLYVDQVCRVWRHLPGQEPGGGEGCSSIDEGGATVVHAVGIGLLAGSTRVIVRTDARATAEGRFFRVRFKAMGGDHDEHVAVAAHEEGGGCEDDGWTRVPAEGWAPLDQLKVRPN